MDDNSILERAKLLSQAATQMASELSNQANEYKVNKELTYPHLHFSKNVSSLSHVYSRW